jgi:hypothetical protein
MVLGRSRIATNVPKTPEQRFEIMEAFRTLATPEDEQFRRWSEIATSHRELEQMAHSLTEICREWALLVRAPLRKYNPDQPRAPAGNRGGGQWKNEDESATPQAPMYTANRRTLFQSRRNVRPSMRRI